MDELRRRLEQEAAALAADLGGEPVSFVVVFIGAEAHRVVHPTALTLPQAARVLELARQTLDDQIKRIAAVQEAARWN